MERYSNTYSRLGFRLVPDYLHWIESRNSCKARTLPLFHSPLSTLPEREARASAFWPTQQTWLPPLSPAFRACYYCCWLSNSLRLWSSSWCSFRSLHLSRVSPRLQVKQQFHFSRFLASLSDATICIWSPAAKQSPPSPVFFIYYDQLTPPLHMDTMLPYNLQHFPAADFCAPHSALVFSQYLG